MSQSPVFLTEEPAGIPRPEPFCFFRWPCQTFFWIISCSIMPFLSCEEKDCTYYSVCSELWIDTGANALQCSLLLLIISNIWFAFLRRGEHWADVFTEILIRNQRSHLWAESQLTVHHCIYDLFPVSMTLYLAESEVHYLTFYLPFYYLVTQSCKVFLQLFTVSPLTSSQFVL